MSSILLTARKRRILGVAALCLFIILLISVTGTATSGQQQALAKVQSTLQEGSQSSSDPSKLVSENVVNEDDGSKSGKVGDSYNQNSRGQEENEEEPIRVNTKKLNNANEMVKDEKSGIIDESKVKQAEENKGSLGDIPLMAGDDAAVAAAAGRAKQGQGDENSDESSLPSSSDSKKENGAQLKGDDTLREAVSSEDVGSSATAPPVTAIQADKQLRSSRKKPEVEEDNVLVDVEDDEDQQADESSESNKELKQQLDSDVEDSFDSKEKKEKKEKGFDAAREFQEIMQLSPVVIFSKTYCPYSKGLKELLKSSYEITPSPAIVELDMHKYGPQLQEYVGKRTGRRTVPNLMVKGVSRGGFDDIIELHKEGTFVKNFMEWAGNAAKIEKINAPSNS